MVVNLVWSMKTRFQFENHGQFQPTTMNFSMHSTEFYVRITVSTLHVKVNTLRRLRNIPTVWLSIFTTLMLKYAVTHVAVKSLLLLLSVLIIHVPPQPISARHILLTQLLIILVVITAFHILQELRPLPSGPCRTKFRYALSSNRRACRRRIERRQTRPRSRWSQQ